MSRLILFHRGTRWTYKGPVWWTDRIEFWYDRKFKHKCLFGSDIFEWKGKKEPGFFFFLTRLLTDSLIKLSGQKKRKKREFSFGERCMRLFYPRFAIKFVIWFIILIILCMLATYYYIFPVIGLWRYHWLFNPFSQTSSLFWSEIDKICIAFHLTVLLCNYIRDWTRCIIFC